MNITVNDLIEGITISGKKQETVPLTFESYNDKEPVTLQEKIEEKVCSIVDCDCGYF